MGRTPLTIIACAAAAAFLMLPTGAAAQEVVSETQFILNSALFLFGGVLVMFMATGFCMLEAGLVRTKNVADICLKNMALYAFSGIAYYVLGYQLMYGGADGGFIGSLGIFAPSELASDEAISLERGFASTSDWFFQMVFVATAASIVSGAVAERIRLIPFLLFTVVLTAVIYPVQGAWKWGGGFLDALGFQDFAGSTIVHSVGGWAAVAGVLMLGPRTGRYGEDGEVHAMPASNLPLATLGTFILWLGWFGFNGASQLALGTASDVVAISQIFANTNMAAAGGVLGAFLWSKIRYDHVNLTLVLNGALGGLVTITAEPLTPSIGQAILFGTMGGVLVSAAIPLLDRLKMDDVVGAIPVHLAAGIFGTMLVPLTNADASFAIQALGVLTVAAFVLPLSALTFFLLDKTLGLRLPEDEEINGSDLSEVGLVAYPEFKNHHLPTSHEPVRGLVAAE
ncbi:MAG: ammonium transporter [Parvularcula sp.]|nr:ammonium transporter [Parvularcula sp.]